MKVLSITIIFLFRMAFAEAHPLHLSITNITYENGKLNISMKTFRDDWEIAYFHYHGRELDFSKEESRQDPWFSKYLHNRFNFALKKGGEPIVPGIDTIKITEDAMLIEMSAALRGKPNSLYIYNALLTDIFPDQTNLVIFEFKESETGIKFDVRKHGELVELK